MPTDYTPPAIPPPTPQGVQARLQKALDEIHEGMSQAPLDPSIKDRIEQLINQGHKALPQGYELVVMESHPVAEWSIPQVRVYCGSCKGLPCVCRVDYPIGVMENFQEGPKQRPYPLTPPAVSEAADILEAVQHEVPEVTVADIETQIEQAVIVLKEGGSLPNTPESVEKVADAISLILQPHRGRFRAHLRPSEENHQDLEVIVEALCAQCRSYECICGREDDLTRTETDQVNLSRLQQLIELEHENTALRDQVAALQDKVATRYEPRTRVPVLDAIIGKKFSVLKDGYVQLIDYMGDDAAIVQAARVSYGEGTKTVRADEALLRYLLRNRHWTPFEMCELKVKVRVPMDAWRQWIRHRTANVNEYSTRYSIAIDSMDFTASKEWRLQSKTNKQGSGDLVDREIGAFLSHREQELHKNARKVYQERLEAGVAREQARKDLPLSTYTEAFWKIDLRNLLNFVGLRLNPHAQLEIRAYAEVLVREIISLWVPWTWKAYQDYHVDSLTLSGPEVELMGALAQHNPQDCGKRSFEAVWERESERAREQGLMSKRELREFTAKYQRLTGQELKV